MFAQLALTRQHKLPEDLRFNTFVPLRSFEDNDPVVGANLETSLVKPAFDRHQDAIVRLRIFHELVVGQPPVA